MLDSWDHHAHVNSHQLPSVDDEQDDWSSRNQTHPNLHRPPNEYPPKILNSTHSGIEEASQENSELERLFTDSQETITRLQNEIIALTTEKEQVLNELNSMQDTQFNLLDKTKKELASNYSIQISSLQQSLLQTERRLQSAEQQFMETERSHQDQIEKYNQTLTELEQKHSQKLDEKEREHAKILNEHNQTHADHVSRITAELGNQLEPTAHVVDMDSAEQEAERLKMIKEKMREMHAIEKSQLLSEHAQEMERLETECQEKIENYRLSAEAAANSQIKGFYEQFVGAHKALEDQKNSEINLLSQEVEALKAQVSDTLVEKTALEEKHMALQESWSAEIEQERGKSASLECELKDWAEKATQLEARSSSSEAQTSMQVGDILKERDETISQIRSECEGKVTAMQLTIDEFQARLQESEALHQKAISEVQATVRDDYLVKLQKSEEQFQKETEEVVAKYEDNLNSLKADHASEVDLLETSVTEHSGERASLEVAEEHMKSLQDQLKRFRSQEQSFETRIDDLNQQHVEDLSLLRQQLQAEKNAEVEHLNLKIGGIEKRLTQQYKDASDAEVVESIQAKHQEEIVLLKDTSKLELMKSLHDLQCQLETSHSEDLIRVNSQMSSTIEELKANSEREMLSISEETKKRVTDEMEASRLNQIQQLENKYEAEISQLNEALLQAERVTLAKSKEKMKSYEGDITELNDSKAKLEQVKKDLLSQLELLQRQKQELEEYVVRIEAEGNQLSADSDRFQKMVKNMEVDASISKSAEEHAQLELKKKESELSNTMTEIDNLEGNMIRMQEEEQSRGIEHQELLDQLERKDKETEILLAESDSLKTVVDSLTKQHQEDLEVCERLKNQLESSWGVSEELEVLKQHIVELKAYKANFEDVQLRMSSLEELNHSKDEVINTLRIELDRSSQVLAEASMQCEEERTNSCAEIEVLKMEVAKYVESESSLKKGIDSLESESNKYSEVVAGLEELVQESKSKLMVAEDRCERYNMEMDKMTHTVDELQSQVTFLKSHEVEQVTEIGEKDVLINELNSKLALELDTEKMNTTKTNEMEQVIKEMQFRIASLEQELHLNAEEKKDLHESMDDLESRLSIADADLLKIEDEKSKLQLDLLQSQGDSLTTNSDSDQLELKFSKLEKEHEELLRERANLLNEVKTLSDNSKKKEPNNVEAKIKAQEEIIRDLQAKLALSHHSSMRSGEAFQHNISRSPLETTLSRARQVLTEKLQEKSAIEKELIKRRVTLERQQAEKQHLEDLLYEKKKFEQELQNQKNILQKELIDLETKLEL